MGKASKKNAIAVVKYCVGDLVFGKIIFCPYWPAIVREIDDSKLKKRAKITFFCDEKSW